MNANRYLELFSSFSECDNCVTNLPPLSSELLIYNLNVTQLTNRKSELQKQ